MSVTRRRPTKRTALSLIGTGLLFLAGVSLHPHAPNAHNMAQVAYLQTGRSNWWPAHVLLLASYLLFVAFLVSVSRAGGISFAVQRVLKLVLPIAVVCVVAMTIHLFLPLGRDSVANSHRGWAFWTKDAVESVDGLWALCVATVAWTLGRARIVGNRLTALLGASGGGGFAVFSIFVPLTGVVVSMDFMRRVLLPVVPMFGMLLVAWAVAAGISALSQSRVA